MENHKDDRLSWHPAFFEAIQMELAEYSNELEFIPEYQLSTEPLRIDVLIIKKSKDISITKNIASIFRNINILEYKSPDDYISINDFYLVQAYAYLFLVLNKADIYDLSLTFMGSRYPRELLTHLQKVRNYSVEEKWPGIYIVKGDILPIQLIDNRKLSIEENIWLKGLDNRLGPTEFLRVMNETGRYDNTSRIGAFLDVISRANAESLREAYKMSNSGLTLEEVLEEVGFYARMEAKVKEKGAMTIAQNMIKSGFSVEQTAELCDLDIGKIRDLADSLKGA